ncbi:MAG: hypothetical protein R3348_01940 [Xanthomonadales bacterium]|nr:hypothetical protein [Xanthomonadales bacterium]
MIRWQNRGKDRHPARTWMIRAGMTLIAASVPYLILGLLGWVPLEVKVLAWNNVRFVAGAAIAGCLLAAVGYGNE